jgi:hypothetical protein
MDAETQRKSKPATETRRHGDTEKTRNKARKEQRFLIMVLPKKFAFLCGPLCLCVSVADVSLPLSVILATLDFPGLAEAAG